MWPGRKGIGDESGVWPQQDLGRQMQTCTLLNTFPLIGFQQRCVLAVFTGVRPLRCGFGAQTDVIIQHPIFSQHVPHLHQQIW